jgi:hypothetical protein
MTDFASQPLPKKHTGAHLRWLSHSSWWQIAVRGLLLYVSIVVLSSAVEAISLWCGCPLVVDSKGNPAAYWDLPYFNFISILTIGYGDFTPVRLGRVISVCEALLGAGLFGLLISVVTAKMVAAPANTVVFSKFAYYCTEDEKFLIVFVNTTRSDLINVDISSYFKLGGDWQVRPSIRSPLIRQSVWTFFLDHIAKDDLVREFKDGDVFRCALAGQVDGARFSAAMQYPADEIVVIPNRNELTAFKEFWDVDLGSEEFVRKFHYRPDGAPTLPSFVNARRSESQKPS